MIVEVFLIENSFGTPDDDNCRSIDGYGKRLSHHTDDVVCKKRVLNNHNNYFK
ncbi:hypothetical protein [Chryseobacterium sp. EO14]|jgi:hypothetical protein|uniref:hypothetical protein n=1 Tax=Chryseobacterium sp. EO14 TaxID=2950551 RepID=UPI0021098DEE|nr:hypothetical protein [Chryseobacterium sp. EO14]MCQ4141959.1 hypothetical protein [Chryseobacterium sp. EO14]